MRKIISTTFDTNSFLLFSLEFSRIRDGGSGGGGGIVEPPSPSKELKGVILDAVNKCAEKMFGISITKFIIADSKAGIDGKVSIRTTPTEGRYARPGMDLGTVTTNVQFTQAGFNQATGYNEDGAGLTPPGGPTPNGRYNLSPYTNYKFKDQSWNAATFPKQFHPLGRFLGATDLAIQIHELGNSLDLITGISYADPNRKLPNGEEGDPDSGEVFEACVRNKLRATRKK